MSVLVCADTNSQSWQTYLHILDIYSILSSYIELIIVLYFLMYG